MKNINNMALKKAYTKAITDIKGRLDGHYQHEGVKWMLNRELNALVGKGGILADDMGLGKTMQTIATMRGNPMKTLIVTIVGTVGQWRDALIEFGGLRPVIVNPSFTGVLPSDAEVVLTTYSCFQKARGSNCFADNVKWGRIVLDEGHKIRNPTSKGNIEISRLETDVKWILSGTPIQNSKKDILSLAKWIGSVGQDVDAIVDEIVLRRTQDEQAKLNPRLALPGLSTQVVRLEFETEDEREFYKKVESRYMGASNTLDTMEAMIRCRQACTHPLLFLEALMSKKKNKKTDTTKRRRVVYDNDNEVCLSNLEMPKSTSKFNYLVNDIVSMVNVNKEKCLVFCTWTNEMKLLQNELKTKNVASLIYDGSVSRDNKEAVIYNFKNTTIPVLIIQITCGNAGLNLQCATRVYITSPHWNPCIELQAIGRAYRKGQLQKVHCVRLAMRGTIEDKCSDIQLDKLDFICEAMNDSSILNRLGTEMEVDTRIDMSVKENKNVVSLVSLVSLLDSDSDCEDMPIV
jgi:SNF2 family DNA or RNA helicase